MRIRSAIAGLSYVSFFVLSYAIIDARADTIVLKNGRRITVSVAKETSDRVTGETDAGQISLPKSMVERVEHGPFELPASVTRSNQSAATNESAKRIGLAPTSQPVFVINPEIARATVHGGSIDYGYIAQLEREIGRASC